MIRQSLLSTDEADKWRAYLPGSVSVFGGPEYAQVRQEFTGYKARLFVLESDEWSVAYPFFLQPTSSLPFSADLPAKWDTRTPDFTGPIWSGPTVVGREKDFAEWFSQYCSEQGIVAEFAHLHPWIAGTELLDCSYLQVDREIVYVDLKLSVEQLWRDSFTHACRKNIRRAQREHVEVYEAETADDVREFHRIYIQTMERNRASAAYYFPLNFFVSFFERMPQNARFVLARYEGRVVAATLYLHDKDSVYSYLGGADLSSQHVRPTNAVVYETILWAKRQGKQRFILGGGYQLDDGIFRFKSSFSPLVASFHVYKRIHLPGDYEILCNAWSEFYRRELDRDGYFPAYRSTPTDIA